MEQQSARKICVGPEYQATIPPFIPPQERNLEQYRDKDLLMWAPSDSISELELDMFINIAKEKYGYSETQALGMLFWHKHVFEDAVKDLPNFIPIPDKWTDLEKNLFEQGFHVHGKNFHRIRQMWLVDMSTSDIRDYYYTWKKRRTLKVEIKEEDADPDAAQC